MNGVEQAIFEEMLLEMRGQTTLLKQLASKSSSGSSGNGTTGSGPDVKGATTASNLFGAALGKLSYSAGIAAGILTGTFGIALNLASTSFGVLAGVSDTLFKGQKALAEASISGSNGLSSFYDSLTGLPGILGLAAQLFSYQNKVLEKNLTTFQSMSQSGATLGGNLDLVRTSARGMYLSMDEFANVMKTNTPYLLNFGQTADDGAKALIKFNTTMIQGSTGKALLGMGYSLEEANNMLGLYSETMGGVNRDQLSNQRGMETSVKSFATELSLSAELEGKTRKQKEDEMKELAANSARENMLSKMSADQKQAYLAAELTAGRAGGKAAQDALLSATLGLPPMTKAAQIYTALNTDAAKHVTDMVPTIMSTSMSAAQRQKDISEKGAQAQFEFSQNSKKYGQTANALAFSVTDVGKQMQANQRAEADARNKHLNSAKDIMDRENNARNNLTKATEGQAGAIAQAAGAAKYQGEWLMNLLASAFEPLRPVLTGLVEAFRTFAPMVINFGKSVVDSVILPLFHHLFAGVSFADIVKPFKDFMKGLFGTHKLDLSGIEKGLEAVLTPLISGLGALFRSIDWVAVGAGVRFAFGVLMDVGKVMGRVLFDAINIAIGVFNVLVATLRGLYNIFDYLLSPLGGFKGILDDLNPVFSYLGDLMTGTIFPIFDNLGNDLTDFAKYISDSTTIIQGPLKTALNLLGGGIMAVVGIFAIYKGVQLAHTIWLGLSTIAQGAYTAAVGIATGGMALLSTAVLFLTSPIGILIAGVAALAAGFYYLYSQGDDLTTVLGVVVDKFFWLVDQLSWMWDKLRNAFGWLSDADFDKNNKARADNAKQRDENAKKRDDDRAANEKSRGFDKPKDKTASPSGFLSTITNPFAPEGTKPSSGNVSISMPKMQNPKSIPKPKPLEKPNASTENKPVDAAKVAQAAIDAKTDDVSSKDNNTDPSISQLNSHLSAMIRILRDIDTNTGKAANLIASNGNMFRR